MFRLSMYRIAILSFILGNIFVYSNSEACFDFTKKITSPLRAAPESFEKDLTDRDHDWATTSGTVEKPIADLLKALLDPKTIRNDSNTHIQLVEKTSADFLKLQEEQIEVKPVFFLTLNWTELWAYSLLTGTSTAPTSLLISYEKTSGTSHIQHYCGNILLKQLSPKNTGVFLYEEMKADHRNSSDILNNLKGTLRTLRTPK